MKRIIYGVFAMVALTFSSCKEEERFATKTVSDGTITFVVDDKALTGTVYAGIVQPNVVVAAARFSKAATSSPNYFNGNIVLTLNVTPELTNIVINIVNTDNGKREQKFQASSVSGSTVWTQAIATLGFANANLAPGTYNFEAVGSSADGSKKVTRSFQLIIIA